MQICRYVDMCEIAMTWSPQCESGKQKLVSDQSGDGGSGGVVVWCAIVCIVIGTLATGQLAAACPHRSLSEAWREEDCRYCVDTQISRQRGDCVDTQISRQRGDCGIVTLCLMVIAAMAGLYTHILPPTCTESGTSPWLHPGYLKPLTSNTFHLNEFQ